MTILLLVLLAADPKIEVAAETPVYVPVQIKVTGTAAKSTSLIEVDAAAWERKTGKHSSEVTGKPGTYTATAIYIENDKDGVPSVVKLKASFKIVGEGPKPDPKPDDPATPTDPTPPVEKVEWATYVYEKDQTAVPSEVMSALNRLNRERGIIATVLDVDVRTGTGDIPAQYRLPFTAAKEAGLPALVMTGGGKVIRTVKNPTTEQAVMDAAK